MEARRDASELETRIREHFDAGRLEVAVTEAIGGYGPELFGCIAAVIPQRADAEDIFADLLLDLWRGLPGFEWRSSFRTWAYVLLRNAINRYVESPQRQRARNLTLSGAPEVERIELLARSVTQPYLRTETKDRFTRLRERLTHDERLLLILRVDRGLGWNEIATIVSDGDTDPASLARRSAALRKRFQVLKEHLRELAVREGLLGDAGGD